MALKRLENKVLISYYYGESGIDRPASYTGTSILNEISRRAELLGLKPMEYIKKYKDSTDIPSEDLEKSTIFQDDLPEDPEKFKKIYNIAHKHFGIKGYPENLTVLDYKRRLSELNQAGWKMGPYSNLRGLNQYRNRYLKERSDIDKLKERMVH